MFLCCEPLLVTQLTQVWSWGGPWRRRGRPVASWRSRCCCWGHRGSWRGPQGVQCLLRGCGVHGGTWADWQNAPLPSSLTLERNTQGNTKSDREDLNPVFWFNFGFVKLSYCMFNSYIKVINREKQLTSQREVLQTLHSFNTQLCNHGMRFNATLLYRHMISNTQTHIDIQY